MPRSRCGLALGLLLAGSAAGGPVERGPMPHLVDLYGDPLPDGAIARLGTLAFRHHDRVSTAAISPDGRRIATASDGRRVNLWDVTTGRLLWDVETGSGRCRVLTFSPDGGTLAVAGDSVWLHDADTGRLRVRIKDQEHESCVALAFSLDGKRLAVGTAGHNVTTSTNRFDVPSRIVLIDVASGRKVRRVGAHESMVEGVAFSPDGSTVAAASRDTSVRLRDANTGKEVRRLPVGDRPQTRVTFSPDGKRLASGDWDGRVTLWDLAGNETVWRAEVARQPVGSLAFSPDGSAIVAGADYSSVRLLDAQSGRQRPGVAGLEGRAWHAAFTPDGRSVVAWGDDHVVHLWDPATDKERLARAGHLSTVQSVAVSPDGRQIGSSGFDGIRLWEAATGREVRRLVDRQFCNAVRFSPDGTSVAGVHEGDATIWDTGTGRAVRTLDLGGWRASGITYAPDGKALITADFAAVRTWDAGTGRPAARFEARATVEDVNPAFVRLPPLLSDLAVSPDGKTVGVIDVAQIRLWDVPTGKELPTLPEDLTGPLTFSPDGRTLACARTERGICFWDLKGRKEVGRINVGPGLFPCALAFAPDGRTVAMACADGSVRVRHYPAGTEVAVFRGHRGAIRCVAFTPDGKALVSTGGDTTILVWSLRRAPGL